MVYRNELMAVVTWVSLLAPCLQRSIPLILSLGTATERRRARQRTSSWTRRSRGPIWNVPTVTAGAQSTFRISRSARSPTCEAAPLSDEEILGADLPAHAHHRRLFYKCIQCKHVFQDNKADESDAKNEERTRRAQRIRDKLAKDKKGKGGGGAGDEGGTAGVDVKPVVRPEDDSDSDY